MFLYMLCDWVKLRLQKFVYSLFWGKGTYDSPHMYISVSDTVDNSQLSRMYKQNLKTFIFVVLRYLLDIWRNGNCKFLR